MEKKLKILVVAANDGGCSYYRALMPFAKLQQHCPDEVDVRFNQNPLGYDGQGGIDENVDYEDIKWADIVMTQNISNFGPQFMIELYQKAKEYDCFIHYDTDDLLTNLYKGHRLYDVYQERKLDELTKVLYHNADLVTVTQHKFAHRIAEFCTGTLAVIKNAIDFELPCWNLPKEYRKKQKQPCRIGWVGGIHHEQDVKQITGLGLSINGKVGPEKIHWGFYGRPPMSPDTDPDDWQQSVWDEYQRLLTGGTKHKNWAVYNAMSSDRYGAFYTGIDVAIAPLEWNDFNDSKSEIKLMEAGRYGIPLIATDCGCYDEVIEDGVTGYLISKENRINDWVKVLSKCIKDPKHTLEMGKNLKEVVNQKYDINKVVHHRLDLYKQVLNIKNEEN
tara:strand:+ start:18617 stop:19783 length:1167 start_codon:yes stop_codon:yes gene_type:complete